LVEPLLLLYMAVVGTGRSPANASRSDGTAVAADSPATRL